MVKKSDRVGQEEPSSSTSQAKKPGGGNEDGSHANDDDALDAMGRKVWDKDSFLEKAKQNIMFGPSKTGGKRNDPVIPLPASQRTFLKQRTEQLNLDKNLGKSATVTVHTIKPMQGGYWCSVCECLLKDSSTYLEHVNGRRHNRNLGMNMKVEKVGVDRVREKLKAMRKEPEAIEVQDIQARIQALEEEQEEKKRRKKEKKKKRKRPDQDEAGEAEDDEEDGPQKRSRNGGPDEGEDAGDITGDEAKGVEESKAKGVEESGEEDENEETEEMKMLKMMGLPTGFS